MVENPRQRLRRRWLSIAVLGAALVCGCDGTTEQAAPATRQDISGEQLQAMMADGEALAVVDVRTPEEYAEGHIPEAVNQPLDQIETWWQQLHLGTRVCCVCRSGGRSAQAADTLIAKGLTKVYNMLGGMNGWSGQVTAPE